MDRHMKGGNERVPVAKLWPEEEDRLMRECKMYLLKLHKLMPPVMKLQQTFQKLLKEPEIKLRVLCI